MRLLLGTPAPGVIGETLEVPVTCENPDGKNCNGFQVDVRWPSDLLALTAIRNSPEWTTFHSARPTPASLRHVITHKVLPLGTNDVTFPILVLEFSILDAGGGDIQLTGGSKVNTTAYPFQHNVGGATTPFNIDPVELVPTSASERARLLLIDQLLNDLDQIQWRISMLRDM